MKDRLGSYSFCLNNIAFLIAVFFISLSFCSSADAKPGDITTIAGGGVGDRNPATSASLYDPSDIAIDVFNNIYISDTSHHRIRKIDTHGVISTIAGNGTSGFSGDGGPAHLASLSYPNGVAVDEAGNIYILDGGNRRIRKIDESGNISTIAGNGNGTFSGDGGPAMLAGIYPSDIILDSDGVIYIADNQRIRKIDTFGIITTIAGNGVAGYSGDGGPAISASFYFPTGIAKDSAGNIYVADSYNHRIRKIDASGIINTIAGIGISGFAGDGGLATSAKLNNPSNIFVDSADNIYIADYSNHRIRKVDASGVIRTIAGNGYDAYLGDGGPALLASLRHPSDVIVDTSNNVLIVDAGNHLIRKVDSSAIISRLAGGGIGDGGQAVDAILSESNGVSVNALGIIYIADTYAGRIRKIDHSGVITTIAGDGKSFYNGDGIPATSASLYMPANVIADPLGNVYITDTENYRIRKVDSLGLISTVAGNGIAGHSGDGGPAMTASIGTVKGISLDSSGSIYIAVTYGYRIRKIDTFGNISTVAGNGNVGFYGDGGLATSAYLGTPTSVYMDTAGNLFIADYTNHRIRKVDSSGIITTVAGNGTFGYSGDGGPAVFAQLSFPTGVHGDAVGNIYIADSGNDCIRRIDPYGVISTLASQIAVSNVSVSTAGDIYFAFRYSDRIKRFQGPIGTIAINAGSPYTNSADTTLSLLCTGTCIETQYSNDNINWSIPGSFSGTALWKLTPDEGIKTVYARFRDNEGAWTDSYSDTILLDTTSPSSHASLAGGSYVSSQKISLSCNDEGSGCEAIYYTTDGSPPTTNSSIYSQPINIPTTTTLKFFAIDKAGNVEDINTEQYTISYALAVNKAGSGSGSVESIPAGISCGNDCAESFVSPTKVTLTTVRDINSFFAGWSGAPDCVDGAITIDSDKTCIATFALIPKPSNLRFWLKAEEGITRDASDLISTWADLSGNGFSVAQGAGEKQPLFVDSQVNSRPVVRFDGIDDYLESAGGINLLNGADASVFVVLRPGDAQEQGAEILDYSEDTGVNFSLQQADTTTNAFGFADSSNKNTQLLDPGSFQVFSGVFQNGQGAVTYLNGGNAKVGSPYTISYTEPSLFTVGNKSGEAFSRHFSGDIAEIVIYNTAVSDSDRQSVEQYLISKYGIDIVPDGFSFESIWPADINTAYISNSITISGINSPSPISITDGEYEINGSGFWTTDPGTVVSGDIVKIRLTSSSSYWTSVSSTLSISGITGTFSVYTGGPFIDVYPPSHDFGVIPVKGKSMPVYFSIYDWGTLPVTLYSVSIIGDDASSFSLAPSDFSPCTIGTPIWYCDFSITFDASSPGIKDATLRILSDDPSTPTMDVPLTGSGAYFLDVIVSPAISGTVTSLPAGINCPPDCEASYDNATTNILLSQKQSDGYYFTGWSGDADCLDGAVTMDNHKTCTANFAPIPFPSVDLRLWLKSDEGISKDGSDLISTWADLSGNGFDVAQGAGEKQPLLVDSQINSKPVVRFDGTDDYLETVGAIDLLNGGDASVFVVLKPDAVQEQGADMLDYSHDTGVNIEVQQADTTTNAFGFADSSYKNTQQLDANSFQVFSGVFQNGQGAVTYLNGGNAKVGDPYTISYTEPAVFTVGNKSGEALSRHFSGDIAEVIVYNTAISNGDRQVVEQYLITKYGIDIVPDTFAFVDQTGMPLSTLISSNSIKVSGLHAASPISVFGGHYSLNGSECNFTAGIVNNDDWIYVCLTSAATFATMREAVVTIGGVSDSFSVTTGSPEIFLTPSSLEYAGVLAGSSEAQQLHIYNFGAFSLAVNSMEITGPNTASFSITSGGTNPCSTLSPTIATGSSCSVLVIFQPDSSGMKSASLVISSNDPDQLVNVPLLGEGVYELNVFVAPTATGGLITGPGIYCGKRPNDCSQQFTDVPTTVNLTATPAEGYYFVRWEGAIAGSANPETVLINGHKSVTARFATDMQVCPTCEHSTIQAALDAAQVGDTIKLAQGTYYEHLVIDSSKEIIIDGGWTSDFAARNANPFLTVIDGRIQEDVSSTGEVVKISADSGVATTLDIRNVTITRGWEGGFSYSVTGGNAALYLRSVAIAGNSGENGGGILLNSTAGDLTLAVENSLIVDNAATNGGGMYMASTDGQTNISINNTTISGNSAMMGGGVYCWSRGAEKLYPKTKNSIIWGNHAVSGKDVMLDSTSPDFLRFDYGASDIGEMNYIGPVSYSHDDRVINEEPLFINPALWDYHVMGNSPVIDAGWAMYMPSDLVVDFEGDNRTIDGDGDAVSVVDMGADEYHAPITEPTSLKLLSLNGGEGLFSGMPYKVVWDLPLVIQSIAVYFTLDNGLTWKKAESTNPLAPGYIVNNQKYFEWNVPLLSKVKKAKIKIVGYAGPDGTGAKVGSDISELPFRIQPVRLVRPNGGESLKANYPVMIRWLTSDKLSDAVAKVKLSYSVDGGLTWKPMVLQDLNIGNPGKAVWLTPKVAKNKTKCKVKVRLFDSAGLSLGQAKSDLFFSLSP